MPQQSIMRGSKNHREVNTLRFSLLGANSTQINNDKIINNSYGSDQSVRMLLYLLGGFLLDSMWDGSFVSSVAVN